MIINLHNNKIYIGSAKDLNSRWRKHVRHLRGQYHPNKHLQFAWDKYGECGFGFEILELVPVDDLLDREQYYLDEYLSYDRNIGYNICRFSTSTLGYKHTEETKQRLRGPRPEQMGENNPFYGKKHTKDTIVILQNLARGKYSGVDNPMYGKRHTEESKSRMSKVKKGKVSWSKITAAIAEKIREEYESGRFTQAELAKTYGINDRSISNVINYKTWKRK